MTQQSLPEWTEREVKRGQDPLGMQHSSTLLYQALLPGISNVTLRIRYYGYFAWLANIYAQRISDTNPETWRYFLRRAEALYALVGSRHGEYNMAGVVWAQRKLAGSAGQIDFNEDANPGDLRQGYLKQKWGVYGAAYGSQLDVTGVLTASEHHLIPLPTKEAGQALAEAFQDALGDQCEPILKAIKTGLITPEQLDSFAIMLPSGIAPDSEERRLYEDLLFARIPAVQTQEAQQRRKTLELVLFLTGEFGEPPSDSDVRWALFSRLNIEGEPLGFPKSLVSHRHAWATYQLNDLTHYALETLLQYVLDTLSNTPRGLPLDRLIATVVASLSENAATSLPPHWVEYLNENVPSDLASMLGDAVPERGLVQKIQDVTRKGGICTCEAAWAALRLLACVHHRYHAEPNVVTAYYNPVEAGQARTVSTEVAFLERYQDRPFGEMVGYLIEERVVRRHLAVAMRKLRYQREYTFLLEMEDGRIKKRDSSGPTLTTPRLAPAITFLDDIWLITEDGLTSRGKQRLEEVA